MTDSHCRGWYGDDYDEFLKRVGIKLCGCNKEKCEMRNRFLIKYWMLGMKELWVNLRFVYKWGVGYI